MSLRIDWRGALAAGAALTVALALARPAAAQDRPGQSFSVNPDSLLIIKLKGAQAQPLDIEALRRRFLVNRPTAFPPGPVASRPVPALDPARMGRLQRAIMMRDRGQLAGARDSLNKLLAEVPHHPYVLLELARTQLALSDFAGVERLARAERAAAKDSILLGRELCEAEERLGRPTDAALVAIEVWAAAPTEFEWAEATLVRLTPADLRATREALRRATAREPERSDLARGVARLAWRASDSPGMVKALSTVDHANTRTSVRWTFAEDLLRSGAGRDTVGALDVLMDVVADRALAPAMRFSAARRVWDIDQARGTCGSGAPAIAKALSDLPGTQWDGGFALSIARSLREGGHTTEARALLDTGGGRAASADLALERALADLRDGPPERALPALRVSAAGSPDGAYQYAEALFFAGQCDSALAWYQRVSADPAGAHTGAALERVFLIEDADPKAALPAYARLCYTAWRGSSREATALADSLYRVLPHRTLWAETALMLSDQRAAAAETEAALEPLLAVADSMPENRLAPLARQRAGDFCRDRLHDDARAAAQYEAFLTRYPRAWNAPEVRRALDRLRRDRRM